MRNATRSVPRHSICSARRGARTKSVLFAVAKYACSLCCFVLQPCHEIEVTRVVVRGHAKLTSPYQRSCGMSVCHAASLVCHAASLTAFREDPEHRLCMKPCPHAVAGAWCSMTGVNQQGAGALPFHMQSRAPLWLASCQTWDVGASAPNSNLRHLPVPEAATV